MRCAFVRMFFWLFLVIPLSFVPAISTKIENGSETVESVRVFFMCLGVNSSEVVSINWGSYIAQILFFIVIFQLIVDVLVVLCARRKGSGCHSKIDTKKK